MSQTSDNMSWKYSRGEWVEIVDPLAWANGEFFEDVLERAGFDSKASVRWGHKFDDVSCDLYTRKGGGERYPVLLSVCLDASAVEHVFVYDFPSLMMFFREFSTPFILLASCAEETHELLRRAFRAWHRHDADTVCRECDPEAYRARQEWRRKHQEHREQGNKKSEND